MKMQPIKSLVLKAAFVLGIGATAPSQGQLILLPSDLLGNTNLLNPSGGGSAGGNLLGGGTTPTTGGGTSTPVATSPKQLLPNWKAPVDGRISFYTQDGAKDESGNPIPERYKISFRHLYHKGGGSDAPEVIILPTAEANTAATLGKLYTEQSKTRRVHYLVLEKEDAQTPSQKVLQPKYFHLSRQVSAKLNRLSDARLLAQQTGALKTVYGRSGSSRVTFHYAGPLDALYAADALRTVPDSVAEANPVIGMQAPQTKFRPNDPLYPQRGGNPGQWHLRMMNCEEAWDVSTGRLVKVNLVDDGIARNHPDLRRNVSNGWNYFSNTSDVFQQGAFGTHGTQMGGLIAAMTNNRIGMAGVAYQSQLTAYALVRFVGLSSDVGLYDPQILPTEIGAAVNPGGRGNVSANSWGFVIDYEDYPQEFRDGMEEALLRGNGGRGLNWVNAAGNFGNVVPYFDPVGTDEMNTRRLSTTIGSHSQLGVVSIYSEGGSALTALAPSDDSFTPPPRLHTTASPATYTEVSGWTSGAAANATGVTALMLKAKPNLSWRDVQELFHRTTVFLPVLDPSWIYQNANGYNWHFQEFYGSGMINAAAAVSTARRWTNLRPALRRFYSDEQEVRIPNNPDTPATKTFRVQNIPRIKVEQVTLSITLLHGRGSELDVTVTSPAGRLSPLMRGNVNIDLGRPPTWEYKSNFSWGECSGGDWTVTVRDLSNNGFGPGILQTVGMEIHGAPAPVAVAPPTILNAGDPLFCIPWHPDAPRLEPDMLPPAYEVCHRYEEYTSDDSKITATQCPVRYWATGLPPNMVVDDVTGQIKGTPLGIVPPVDQPPGTPIIYTVTLYAQNERGTTSKIMRMPVYPQVAVAFTEPSNVANATVGESFVWRINFREDAPHRYRIGGPTVGTRDGRIPGLPGTLVPELDTLCNSNSYVTVAPAEPIIISGVPTAPGYYHFSIIAENYCGSSTLDYYLNVQPEGRSFSRASNSYGQIFTLEGADSWFTDDGAGVDGTDALASPIFDQNPAEPERRTASIVTSVRGPSTLTFCWRSQTAPLDSGKFFLDDRMLASISGVTPAFSGGSQGWVKESFPIPAGDHTIRWSYDNFDPAESPMDHVWLDDISLTYPTLAAALDITNPQVVVTSTGSTGDVVAPIPGSAPAPWLVQATQRTLGVSAAQSGFIGDGNTSSMNVRIPGPGAVSFRWRVHTPVASSETRGDFLVLYVDGVRSTTLTGASGWIYKELVFTGEGPHDVRFAYEKDTAPAPLIYLFGLDEIPGTGDDQNGSDGIPGTADDLKDKAWVDDFRFTPAPVAATLANNSAGITRLAPAQSRAATSGSVNAVDGSYTRSQSETEVTYSYQIDGSRSDSARTAQISADGVVWTKADSLLKKQEGSLQSYEVRGSVKDATFNFFRLVP
jgi:proprotein convertase subtilisin/kexin type 2